MNCLLIERSSIDADRTVLLGPRESTHIINVLRKKPGDQLLVGIVDGPMGMTQIIAIQNGTVRIQAPGGDTPSQSPVDIILAMPRPKVMKRLWSPLASLGVQKITIIGADRVEPYYFDSHAIDASTYRPRLLEGLEQARDTRMPEVHIVKSFPWFAENHLPELPSQRLKLIAHPGVGDSVREAVHREQNASGITVAVGPEGGWTNVEIDAFQQNGFIPVGMRERALRTDVAIIGLLTLVHDAL